MMATGFYAQLHGHNNDKDRPLSIGFLPLAHIYGVRLVWCHFDVIYIMFHSRL